MNRARAAVLFDPSCRRCPRLATFLDETRGQHPGYHCAPVAPFGDPDPRLLIVGLAPGLHGANATGRPFTGDHAGLLLYRTLYEFGFASRPESRPGDGLVLPGCRITNSVKCVPPGNKPQPDEIRNCNAYLAAELRSLRTGTAVLALGAIAHDAVLAALDVPRARARFAHGAEHELPNGLRMIDSYHCSRYNTQTGRLTTDMFRTVIGRAAALARSGH